MKYYINRAVLKQNVLDLSSNLLCSWDTLGVLAVIDKTPPADVREVVHGRWKKVNVTAASISFYCSECGADSVLGIENYCWNCGARMDGDSD